MKKLSVWGYSGGRLENLRRFLSVSCVVEYRGAGELVACSISLSDSMMMLGDLEYGKSCVGMALR